METTKIIAVPHPSVPVDKFVSDGDPNTLELVFMPKTAEGPSHVSDDGEVIFLSPDATDKEQSALFSKAFDIRVKRRISNPAPK